MTRREDVGPTFYAPQSEVERTLARRLDLAAMEELLAAGDQRRRGSARKTHREVEATGRLVGLAEAVNVLVYAGRTGYGSVASRARRRVRDLKPEERAALYDSPVLEAE